MPRFCFLHAADLHLDSPLTGLRRRSAEQAARLADASREAFDALIDLALARECRFVVIAGDVFDGAWQDWRTGLFFASRMARLREAGIPVLLILGNHDAENRFVRRLELSDNVRLLSARRPESVELPEWDVAVHGQSFAERDVRDNLALGYPPPSPGRLNIGLLHTACTGRDGHQPYAPCTPEQLANHGYDYWALGHVHAREVLAERPWIVYPGNLQGRSVRETGAKGATLVEVEDRSVRSVEHWPLDRVRWALAEQDIAEAGDREAVLALVRGRLEQACRAADGRALALRLRLTGESACHAELVAGQASLGEEIETLAAGLGADVWIERVELRTTSPCAAATSAPSDDATPDPSVATTPDPSVATTPDPSVATTPDPSVATTPDPSVAGRMRDAVDALAGGDWLERRLEAKLAEIAAKVPEGARREALLDALRQSAAERARALALALIDRG